MKKLNNYFLNQKLMNVLGVVYPRYLVATKVEASFLFHLEVIMSLYYVP